MTRRVLRNWLLRLAAGGVVYACLVGPAPGNVGGCGASNPTISASEHCINKRFFQCERDLFAGRTTEAERDDCRIPIMGACGPASWDVGCEPTRSQSEGCMTLLRRSDRLSFTTEDLLATFPDCNLCP